MYEADKVSRRFRNMLLAAASLAALVPACTVAQSASGGGDPTEQTGTSQAALAMDSTGGWYYLVNSASSLCLDDQNGSLANNSALDQAACMGTSNTQWMFYPLSNGLFQIVNRTSGLCLNNEGMDTTGSPVNEWGSCTGNPSNNLQWGMSTLANGTVNIVNQGSNLCLTDPGASTASGTLQDQETCVGTNAAQQWKLIPVAPVTPSGKYYVVQAYSHFCLDDHGGGLLNNGPIDQDACAANTNTQWSLNQVSPGVFKIQNTTSGGCLQDPGGSMSSGTVVNQWLNCANTSSNLLWTVQDLGNGFVTFTNVTSGLCLGDPGESTSAGTLLDQYYCSNATTNPGIEWQLIPISPNGTTGAGCATGPTPWAEANTIMCAVQPPTFPANTFNVSNYGAVGDGTTDNTAAFASAVSACVAAGGGVVEVPSGNFVSGAIRLYSNVNLQVDAGATIMFSGDVSKYPQVVTRYGGIELMNASPMVYAYGATNVAITGAGVLDGTNTASWNVAAGDSADDLMTWSNANTPVAQRTLPVGETLPVAMVEPYNCTNVLIQGVTVQNSSYVQFHPTMSTNVTINGAVPLDTQDVGVSLESDTNVVVENMTVVSGDDAIALKSGADNDGRRVDTPSSNVVVSGVTFSLADGADGAMIAVGGEMSGNIYHTYAYNLSASGNNDRLLHMRSNASQGGMANDINIDTVTGSSLANDVACLTFNDDSDASWAGPAGFNPVFSGVTLSHLTIGGVPQVLDMDGLDTDTNMSITFNNDTFTNLNNGPVSVSDGTVAYSNTTLNGTLMQ